MRKKFFALLSLTTALLAVGCTSTDSSISSNGTLPSFDSTPISSSSSGEPVSSSSSPLTSSTSSNPSSSSEEPVKDLTGSGSISDPYVVNTLKGLKDLSSRLSLLKTYVELGADIDLNGEEWTPIGDFDNPVNIDFDGKGHTIRGLSIKSTPDERDTLILGLFGAALGQFSNVNIEGVIDLIPLATDAYAGLLVGYTNNVVIQNVHTSGSIRLRALGQYQSVYAGGIVGMFGALSSIYCDITACSSTADLTAEGALAGIAGGIAASLSTSTSSLGISAINSCTYSEGSISASLSAGGIVGSTFYYASVVNSIVNAKAIEVTGGSSYFTPSAGGIVGESYYENAFLYNIVDTTAISAEEGVEANVGTIGGILYESGLADGMDIGGTSVYGNLTATSTWDEELLTSYGFDKYYALNGSGLPTLKSDYSYLIAQGEATLFANDGSDLSHTFTIDLGLFNQNVVVNPFESDDMLVGISYDSEEYIEYKWYAPVNADISLYDIWYDPSPIVGWHLGSSSYNPDIYLGRDGTFLMFEYDGHFQEGSYWSDGDFIVVTNTNYDGTVITIDDDGFLSFPDVNDSSYIYEYSKAPEHFGYYRSADGGFILFLDSDGTGYANDGSSKLDVTWETSDNGVALTIGGSEVEATSEGETLSFTYNEKDYALTSFNGIMNFTGGYVGLFHGETYDLELYANGNLDMHYAGSESVYYFGAYRAYGNSLEINARYVTGSFLFDEESGLLYAVDGSNAFSKNGTFESKFIGEGIAVYHFEEGDGIHTYVIIGGALDKEAAIEGEFIDGQTVVINGKEYEVEGETLIAKEPVDTSAIAGTYKVSVNENAPSVTFVINADGTGVYDGLDVELSFDGTNLTFTAAGYMEFDLTYDSATGKITGSYNDGEYDWSVELIKNEIEVEPEETNLLGTWTGKLYSGVAWTIEIREDGTLALDLAAGSFEGTWTGDLDSAIEISVPDFSSLTGTLTLDSEDEVSLEAEDYDYNTYSLDMTRVAE